MFCQQNILNSAMRERFISVCRKSVDLRRERNILPFPPNLRVLFSALKANIWFLQFERAFYFKFFIDLTLIPEIAPKHFLGFNRKFCFNINTQSFILFLTFWNCQCLDAGFSPDCYKRFSNLAKSCHNFQLNPFLNWKLSWWGSWETFYLTFLLHSSSNK